MALVAKITKISRSISSPQIDVEVSFTDTDKKFNVQRVFNFGEVADLEKDKVFNQIRKVGEEYKKTLSCEDSLKTDLEGQEITI